MSPRPWQIVDERLVGDRRRELTYALDNVRWAKVLIDDTWYSPETVEAIGQALADGQLWTPKRDKRG